MRTVVHKKSTNEWLAECEPLSQGRLKDLCELFQGYLDTVPLEYKNNVQFDYYADEEDVVQFVIYYNRPHTEEEKLSLDLKETAAELRDKYDRMQQYLKLKEEFEEK